MLQAENHRLFRAGFTVYSHLTEVSKRGTTDSRYYSYYYSLIALFPRLQGRVSVATATALGQ